MASPPQYPRRVHDGTSTGLVQHFALLQAKGRPGQGHELTARLWVSQTWCSSGRKVYFQVVLDVAVRPVTGIDKVHVNRQRFEIIQVVQFVLLTGVVF